MPLVVLPSPVPDRNVPVNCTMPMPAPKTHEVECEMPAPVSETVIWGLEPRMMLFCTTIWVEKFHGLRIGDAAAHSVGATAVALPPTVTL